MELWEAIILGILQGIAEFLPISSSGHIELGQALLNAEIEEDLAFTVLLHGATVLSTIVVFREDIWRLIRGILNFKWDKETKYVAMLLLSMLPVGIVGVLFKDNLEAIFSGNIFLVGCCLIVTAGILFLTTLDWKKGETIGIKEALLIGLSQAVAVLPGISRSGTTISTALALGISREEATRFSFLMVLAPILGASLLEIKDLGTAANHIDAMPFIAGFIAAFVAGLFACTWMKKLVNEGKIWWFSIYCLIVGLVAIGASYM